MRVVQRAAAIMKRKKGLEIMEIVNRRFKEFREALQMSEREFAEKTGIKLERVKKIEAGRVKVSREEVLAVSDHFGVSADYILGLEKQPRPVFHSEADARIWRGLQGLSGEELDEVMKALEEKGKSDG